MPPVRDQDTRDVDRILDSLAEQLGPRRYGHWFDGKTRFALAGDLLTVSVGSPYLLTWIQKQFLPVLTKCAQEVLGPGVTLRLDVDAQAGDLGLANPSSEIPPSDGAAPATDETSPSPPALRALARTTTPEQTAAAKSRTQFTRRYADLAQFVTGPCNELALTASLHVAGAPGAEFNPLYLHGPVGNGKTHLLEGVYREVRRQFPALQVMLITAEAFTNYFTLALRERSLPNFRQRFRNVDVLLVDDVDFLDGKKGIQEEFLHTFKKLESEGRQIVLTADRHPRLLGKLSDELVTRFLSGLVCRIEAPEDETRRRIVRQIAARRKLDAADDALDFVARQFTRNVREIEGAINCLHTFGAMTRKRVTAAMARDVLARLERDCIRIVRLADVETAVCEMFGVTAIDLKSPKRSRALSQPRMLAMYLVRRLTQTSYSEIGQHFGGRNHATVISAEQKIAELLSAQGSIQVAAESWPAQDVVRMLEQRIKAS